VIEKKEIATKKAEVKIVTFDQSAVRPTVRIGNFTVDHKLSLIFD
jgi:hypothetical protein